MKSRNFCIFLLRVHSFYVSRNVWKCILKGRPLSTKGSSGQVGQLPRNSFHLEVDLRATCPSIFEFNQLEILSTRITPFASFNIFLNWFSFCWSSTLPHVASLAAKQAVFLDRMLLLPASTWKASVIVDQSVDSQVINNPVVCALSWTRLTERLTNPGEGGEAMKENSRERSYNSPRQ